jgi:hypothetical protein
MYDVSHIQDQFFFYFSPSLSHKAQSGTAKVMRLEIATHLNQLNHLANQQQQQVLSCVVPEYHPLQKCWAKTILLTIYQVHPKDIYIWQNPLFTTHSLGH